MSRDNIRVEIVLGDDSDDSTKLALHELKDCLFEAEIQSEATESLQKGVKGDLNTYVSIAGLGLSTVSTLISVVSFWQSNNQGQEARVVIDNKPVEISKLNKDELSELSGHIVNSQSDGPLIIKVNKK